MEPAEINRQPISVTLPPVCIEWLDSKVEARLYASRSHAVEVLILAAMREPAGSGVAAPAAFQVEKQFTVTQKNSNELADLKSRFARALDPSLIYIQL